jgi:hypothetical protein
VGLHACPLTWLWEHRKLQKKGQQEEPKEKAFSISSESGLSLQKALAKKGPKGSSLKGKANQPAGSTDLDYRLLLGKKDPKKRTKTYKNGLQHQ